MKPDTNRSKQMPPQRSLPWGVISALTLVFVGAYFVLRALPDAECGFLHYEKIVHPDGTVEFCATNHAGFLDLTRLDYPVRAEMNFETTPTAGSTAEVVMDLETSGGMPMAPHQLAFTHTKQMHLMVIDPSLEDYHHLHPVAEGIGGQYRFSFTPEQGGAYRFFTEVVPLVTRRQLIASSEADVAGPAHDPVFTKPSYEWITNGLRFKIEGLPETLETGRDYRLQLSVKTLEGASAPLEEVMGAYAHMVAFDADRRGFAHMHPEASLLTAQAGIVPAASAVPETLDFVFNVPNPGWYRIFAQIQINGEDVYGRFDCKVVE